MMACVHAAIGAALGSRIKRRSGAFSAGVASHLLADLIPHRDFPLPVEVPLLIVMLGAIGLRYGWQSSEMAGAIGAISPDFENGLETIGVTSGTLFWTHTRESWYIGHGRPIESPWPQAAIVAACAALIEIGRASHREPS
jgi:hypothetical protein